MEGERKQVTVLFADVKGSIEPTGIESLNHWIIASLAQSLNESK